MAENEPSALLSADDETRYWKWINPEQETRVEVMANEAKETAPERVWIEFEDGEASVTVIDAPHQPESIEGMVQYIRADITAARVKRLEQALRDTTKELSELLWLCVRPQLDLSSFRARVEPAQKAIDSARAALNDESEVSVK